MPVSCKSPEKTESTSEAAGVSMMNREFSQRELKKETVMWKESTEK